MRNNDEAAIAVLNALGIPINGVVGFQIEFRAEAVPKAIIEREFFDGRCEKVTKTFEQYTFNVEKKDVT